MSINIYKFGPSTLLTASMFSSHTFFLVKFRFAGKKSLFINESLIDMVNQLMINKLINNLPPELDVIKVEFRHSKREQNEKENKIMSELNTDKKITLMSKLRP